MCVHVCGELACCHVCIVALGLPPPMYTYNGALTIKPIDLSYLPTLVVSSEQYYLVWVHGLQC